METPAGMDRETNPALLLVVLAGAEVDAWAVVEEAREVMVDP